jgi:hypothetical protein
MKTKSILLNVAAAALLLVAPFASAQRVARPCPGVSFWGCPTLLASLDERVGTRSSARTAAWPLFPF